MLNDIVLEASNSISEFPNTSQKSMLERIPYFMVSKMLESSGLSFKKFI